MTTKIKKWGNSMAVRIPKEILRNLNLGDKAEVEITQKDNKIEIKPTLKTNHRYVLGDLVKKITPDNTHQEIDWGTPQGEEIW